MFSKTLNELRPLERVVLATTCVVFFLVPLSFVQCMRSSQFSARIDELDKQLDTIRLKSNAAPTEAQRLATAVVPIGIRYTQVGGRLDFSWHGTSFAVEGTDQFATAAHVVGSIKKEKAKLDKRGSNPEIVCRLPSSLITPCTDFKIHPRYSETHKSRNRPAIDVALFSVATAEGSTRLPLSKKRPLLGEQILIAGFPTSVSQVKYDSKKSKGFGATVRIGRIERIVGLHTLATGADEDLIQHNVPVIGGFSGGPVLNMKGEVVGITTWAKHRMLSAKEVLGPDEIPTNSTTTRFLDAAHISFALSSDFLREMLAD